jgi:hypothetical protein
MALLRQPNVTNEPRAVMIITGRVGSIRCWAARVCFRA